MSSPREDTHVVIVGGGFAGVACARGLSPLPGVRVTLVDRHNYQQFQPLLYQVATSQLPAADVGLALRAQFANHPSVTIRLADVTGVDAASRTVTTAEGASYTGDYLVLAAGGAANFFGTPGAEEQALPLYSLPEAVRLNSRVIGLFEEVENHPELLDAGHLNFVIVGGGATGTEIAGALADMLRETMTVEYPDVPVHRARVVLVDHGDVLLAPFSEHAHHYAAEKLSAKGVELRLGTGVSEIREDHVVLSDGTTIPSRCVVWGGGIQGAAVLRASGIELGHGGRPDARPDLRVEGLPGVYVAGDAANITDRRGQALPQLGSVAQQSGAWVARNIAAELTGAAPQPFRYLDKGIMAMIGRRAAVAEVGPRRWEVDGLLAFVSWLGVHAMLMTSWRTRVESVVSWTWDYFSRTRGPQLLIRPGDLPGD